MARCASFSIPRLWWAPRRKQPRPVSFAKLQDLALRENVELADPYLFRIRDLIYRASGIYQPDNKFYVLENRCAKRREITGASSLCDYFRLLTTGAQRDTEMRSLLNE